MRSRFTCFGLLLCALTLLVFMPQKASAQYSGNVLYVTKALTTSPDTVLRNKFTAMGFTVVPNVITTGFKLGYPSDDSLALYYKFVYISDAVGSADCARVRGLKVPIVTHKVWIGKLSAGGFFNTAAKDYTTDGDVVIMDKTGHALSAGHNYGDTVKLASATRATKYLGYFPMDTIVKIIPIAKIKGDLTEGLNTKIVIAGLEKGTLTHASASATDSLAATLAIASRVAMIGISAEADSFYTDEAWKLTKAAIDWATELSVDVKDVQFKANEFALAQNYPNPFNPTTTITYNLGKASNVKLTVYNTLGKEVATLVNEQKAAGTYRAEFNSNGLPSGIYLYKLNAGNYSEVRKMILMK
jgi:hypothetical protein